MRDDQLNPSELPVVVLTLGDAAGIGPELIAKKNIKLD